MYENTKKSRNTFWAVRFKNNSLVTCITWRFILIMRTPKLILKHTLIQILNVEHQVTLYLPTPERPSDILKITIRIS